MSESELEPCPFCGGRAILRTGEECAVAQCLAVSAHRLIIDGDNDAANEVTQMWNMRRPPYTQLEIEHCVHAENRWGESFVEAVHDLERATLSDVLEEFWTIYGRHPDGRAEALHDTGDHTQAYIIAMLLSRVAFNHIPVKDNSPEGQLEQLRHDHAPGGPGTA